MKHATRAPIFSSHTSRYQGHSRQIFSVMRDRPQPKNDAVAHPHTSLDARTSVQMLANISIAPGQPRHASIHSRVDLCCHFHSFAYS